MLDLKKLLAKVLAQIKANLSSITTLRNNAVQITSVSTSVKTGTSTYSGHYYADKAVTTPSGYTFLCLKVTSVTDNHFAVVHQVWAGTYRAFTRESNKTVSFTVYFYKVIG